ncbi:hypothetical protein U9M48_031302 [Paspalum notatum var. saurae]|uniref:Uncharacterized protein n=1 Tax=Paspalum notatum var. saurae TaxID=547442 RepID=A0AAQ3X4M0_PASNO
MATPRHDLAVESPARASDAQDFDTVPPSHRRIEPSPPPDLTLTPLWFNATIPLILSTPSVEIKGKRSPVDQNTFLDPVGLKTARPYAPAQGRQTRAATRVSALSRGRRKGGSMSRSLVKFEVVHIRDQGTSAWSYVKQLWSKRPTKTHS